MNQFPSMHAVLIVGLAALAGCSEKVAEQQQLRDPPGVIERLTPFLLDKQGTTNWMSGKTGPVTRDQVQLAQLDMLRRVGGDVGAYATKIELGSDWENYCRDRMRHDQGNDPDDPTGTSYNYNSIQTWELLEVVLNAREDFERGYQVHCLAEVKVDLVRAAQK